MWLLKNKIENFNLKDMEANLSIDKGINCLQEATAWFQNDHFFFQID